MTNILLYRKSHFKKAVILLFNLLDCKFVYSISISIRYIYYIKTNLFCQFEKQKRTWKNPNPDFCKVICY